MIYLNASNTEQQCLSILQVAKIWVKITLHVSTWQKNTILGVDIYKYLNNEDFYLNYQILKAGVLKSNLKTTYIKILS